MANSFMRRLSLAIGVFLLTISSACASATQPTTPQAASLAATPEEQPGVQAERELGPGEFDLPDPQAGLAELSSYSSTLTMTFEGKAEGQPAQWTRTYALRSSKDPAARLWTMETTEAIEPVEPVGRAESRGADYEIFGDGSCVARVLDPANSGLADLEPAGLLSGLLGAEASGHEALEGIEADHYTFDERALLQAGQTKSSGEVWVASEGGYVLRFHDETTAGEEFFGEGTEGTLQRDYQLTEVNQPVTIELPASCPLGLVDAPRMPDAASVLSVPGMLQYESAASVGDVRAFYEQELPALGWVDPATTNLPEGVSGENYQQMLDAMKALGISQPTAVPSEGEGMLFFERGNETLTVVITPGDSGTRVILSLGPKAN